MFHVKHRLDGNLFRHATSLHAGVYCINAPNRSERRVDPTLTLTTIGVAWMFHVKHPREVRSCATKRAPAKVGHLRQCGSVRPRNHMSQPIPTCRWRTADASRETLKYTPSIKSGAP